MKKGIIFCIYVITILSIVFTNVDFSHSADIKPVGSNYANNATNTSFNSAGKSNADSILKKDAQGNYSTDSIKAYQTLNGLTVDGKIGAETAAALNNEKAGGSPSGRSSTAGKDYSTNNITGQSNADLRDGNVDMYTIPLVIVAVTEMLIKIAGTIAVLALVYHSVQMQINSGITGDSTGTDKAKKGMIGSMIGFVVAVSAWFLVTRALDLLSAL